MNGYGGATSQFPPVDAIGIKFDASGAGSGQNYPAGGLPSSTGLYLNQGPSCHPGGALGLCPCSDLNPYGINFYSNRIFEATIVYDGSLLTLTILDTVSNAQARFAWPLNLANTTNGTANYVGFSCGSANDGVYLDILSWSYWTGYNERLATPTFSPSPGNYPNAQTVTISYPAGSTCYYTTNGFLPTSSSTKYTGPITVSANTVLQAIAIQSDYTDSLVQSGNFVIGSSSNAINFPGGFAAGNLVPVGYAHLSGTAYRLSDTTNDSTGAVWFPLPVGVSTFTTTFALNWTAGGQGMCFVLQNNPAPYIGLTGVKITGTSGQVSFDDTTLSAGQYVTIAGTFGGTGSIAGYNDPTTYLVGETNGTSTATLQAPGVASSSQNGTTFNTAPQTLTAGTPVGFAGYTTPQGFVNSATYYVASSGLTTTTCELSATEGGAPISCGNSTACTLVPILSGGGATLTTTEGTPSGLTVSLNARNWSGGPTVLGASQNALGYGGMNAIKPPDGQAFGLLHSVAIAFNQFAIGSDPSNGIGLYTNGEDPYGSQKATGLSFVGSFNVTLSYDGTTLSLSMQSTSGGPVFKQTWTIDIPATVGADTAYVGFTGSTGGAASVQAVESWTYAGTGSSGNAGEVPAAPTNLRVR